MSNWDGFRLMPIVLVSTFAIASLIIYVCWRVLCRDRFTRTTNQSWPNDLHRQIQCYWAHRNSNSCYLELGTYYSHSIAVLVLLISTCTTYAIGIRYTTIDMTILCTTDIIEQNVQYLSSISLYYSCSCNVNVSILLIYNYTTEVFY